MKKRIISILLTFCLCLSLLPTVALAAGPDVWDGSTKAPSGSGTSESDPYLISTGEELAWLSTLNNTKYTNYYVKLTNDIILNEGTFDQSGNLSPSATPKAWTPAQQAVWHFDGNDHYISGLYINSNSADNVGLFSYLYGNADNRSNVNNLTIKNSYIRLTRDKPQYGNGYAGVFSGKSYRTDFTNCFSENNILSTSCYATAGIVGDSSNCSFNGVHTSGSVNGSRIIGGIAGYDDGGTFKNCWNEAKISNEKESIRQSGGIAGQALNSNFYNCANLGSLYGGSRVGGIVGEAKGVTIKNCYGLKSIQEYKIDGKGYGTYPIGTLAGTGASVSLSYAEDGFERNDNGETGVVPHFTGKGKLTESGDENDLLKALNDNLYEMDGELGLNEWSRTNDGYPLPNGGTFNNTTTYYNIWLDGVRVSEHNQGNILKNGLASYDYDTNTLYLHDGLVVTRAYNNSLLYTEGDINLCVDGSVEFRSAQNVGGSPIVINLGEATAGGNLRIYAPEGQSAAVTVTGAYSEYGIDVHSLTLGGDVCLTVRTTSRQCFAACSKITLQSAKAVLDAENLSGNHSMLNFVSSVNLPTTNPQKLYEGTGTDLTCVEQFTKERETESGTTEPYMYPHIRIAPEVYALSDTLPKSLTVSMTEANTEVALSTWAAGQIRTGDITAGNSEITVSDVVPAVAGSNANESGTDGSFTVTVKLTKNGISKTTTIPGTITATAYTAPPHTHSWATAWSKNETHHWHECTADGCDVTNNADKNCYAAHTYDQEIATADYKASDATCTAKAIYYKSCICGAKGTETFESGEVNASNHTGTLSGWQTDSSSHWKEYPCCGAKAEEGTHDYTDDADTDCNTCGYERTITPSHTHSWATAWSKNETHHWHECTADGCDVTDNAEKDSYAEHAYDQEIATDEYKASDATCTAKATYYKSCVCGAKSTETFESGGVNASNHTGTLSGWQTDSSSHWKEYPCCGAKADDVAHTFKWVIDKEATTAEKGSKHEECTVCGYKKAAVEIPATGSSTGETTPDETNPDTGATTLPATGDNNHMALWIALLFVSGAGVIGTTVYGKKKRAK